MADIYFFIGAVLGVAFITALVFGLISRWNADVPGILTANGLSLFVSTVIAGFGLADGGDPVFGKAFATYVVPQLVVLFVFLWRWNRRRGREAGEIPPSRWSARSKGIAAAVAIVFVIALAGAIGSTVRHYASTSIVADVRQASADINANLPQRLDDTTILRRTYAEGATLVYLNELADGYELNSLDAIKASILLKVCSDELMRSSILNGVTYAYEYTTASTGRNWGRVTISSCPPT